MRGKPATLGAAAIAAFAAFGAGCGGDDATTSSVTSTPTTTSAVATDEFITAADARCAEANAAIANLNADDAAGLEQQQSITEQTLKGLKALGSPADPDGSLKDYYDAVEEQISVLGQQQSALASGDSATSDSLQVQLEQAQSDARTAAESFGFEECGQEGTAIGSATTTAPAPSGTGVTTTPAPAAPTTTPVPAPAPPATPPPAPPSGGTGAGGTGGTGGGGTGGGSSGGISPG